MLTRPLGIHRMAARLVRHRSDSNDYCDEFSGDTSGARPANFRNWNGGFKPWLPIAGLVLGNVSSKDLSRANSQWSQPACQAPQAANRMANESQRTEKTACMMVSNFLPRQRSIGKTN